MGGLQGHPRLELDPAVLTPLTLYLLSGLPRLQTSASPRSCIHASSAWGAVSLSAEVGGQVSRWILGGGQGRAAGDIWSGERGFGVEKWGWGVFGGALRVSRLSLSIVPGAPPPIP